MEGAWYFVTASTVEKAHLLSSDEHLNLWATTFKELVAEFKMRLSAWVVLPHHYHFLGQPQHGREIGLFMKRLNGRTSHELNALEHTRGRKVWYSYWDTCIRGEHDFWTRFNYIHYNPVKHGFAEKPEDWNFSSYRYYLRNDGHLWLDNCFREFSTDLLFDDDKF